MTAAFTPPRTGTRPLHLVYSSQRANWKIPNPSVLKLAVAKRNIARKSSLYQRQQQQ